MDYDLESALEYNICEHFGINDIEYKIAEVPGMNDEFDWWWILQLKNGKFALLSAWCDYTGWDCQSAITVCDIFNSALEAANKAPELEKYSNRSIRKNLIGQLNGDYPKFTYWES